MKKIAFVIGIGLSVVTMSAYAYHTVKWESDEVEIIECNDSTQHRVYHTESGQCKSPQFSITHSCDYVKKDICRSHGG